jgi:hypothetical protein
MKKNLITVLILVFILGIFGTASAANLTIFSDVPPNHWSYGAIQQLYKNGLIDGYSDGTFQSDKTMSRYEMAILVARAMTKLDKADKQDKVLIEKLKAEYTQELEKIGALDQRVTTRESEADRVAFDGMLMASYNNERVDNRTLPQNNYFYLNLMGHFKIDDTWDAHFQSENYQNYQIPGNYGGSVSNPNNNVFERIWATGKVGNVGVTFGRKWDQSAYGMIQSGEATGVWLDYGKAFNTTLFYAKPTASIFDLFTGWDISMYGVRIAYKVSENTNLGMEVGGNNNGNGIGLNGNSISRWGGLSFDTKLSPDIKLTAEYSKTNADSYNRKFQTRLIYKNADLSIPHSYDIFLGYDYLGPNGAVTFSNSWGILANNVKGVVVGVDYVLAKNVQLQTMYFDEKFIASGYNYGGVTVSAGQSRKMFRSTLQLNF